MSSDLLVEQLRQVIEMMGKIIEEKDEIINELQAASIKRLLDDPPTMNLECRGSNTSHISTGHMPAKSKEVVFELSKMDWVDSKHKLGRGLSQLLGHFNIARATNDASLELTYASEADISNVVVAALKDAITLVEARTGRELLLYNEYSMFSNRPDHLVVKDARNDVAIMAVEDKKPGSGNTSISSEGKVIGQVYDYIEAMNAFGQATPFVVLTTFKTSAVFWKDDEESNELARDVDIRTIPESVNECNPIKTPSPAKKIPTPKKITPTEGDEQMVLSCFTPTGILADGRSLLRSREYGPDELVPLLFSVIMCGLVRNHADVSPTYKCVKIRDYFEAKVLRLKESGKIDYTWGELKTTIQSSVVVESETKIERSVIVELSKKRKHSKDPSVFFYVFDITARGDTSKAFHALDENSCVCLIKMYVKRYDSNNKIFLEPEEFRKIANEKTSEELEVLKQLYPKFGEAFRCAQIMNHACVIMPFFRPLAEEERSNNDIREKIKEILTRLAELGKKYKDEDVRWHHIGIYERQGNKDEVVLFDLADLETTEKDQCAVSAVVRAHMAILEGRLKN